jgi:hypothetical protein
MNIITDASGLTKVDANNAVAVIPEGFLSASLANVGDADGAFTHNGFTFTLITGGVFNFPQKNNNSSWKSVSINGTGTHIEAAYF